MTELELTLIRNPAEWAVHCEQLNGNRHFYGRHNGEPREYPCWVESTFGPNWNGPDYWDHKFIYRDDLRRMLVDMIVAT